MSPQLNPNRHLVRGPQAVAAATAMLKQKSKDAMWPYDWEYAPPGSKEDQGTGYVAVPAAASTVIVAQYQVPDGGEFYPTAVTMFLLGATYAPGDFTWSLLLNAPANVVAAQAYAVDGYANVPFSLGTLEIPWAITRGDRNKIHSRDVLSIQATLPVGSSLLGSAGNFCGVIKGYVLFGSN